MTNVVHPTSRACRFPQPAAPPYLDDADEQAILALPGELADLKPHADPIRPGDTVRHAILTVAGRLGRYDLMRDGSRQITALYLPGDMCDLHSVLAPTTGWGITALAPTRALFVPHKALKDLPLTRPTIALAFWRDTTVDASLLAKAVANIGRKDAYGRIAHVLCELAIRLERAGHGTRADAPLELTQQQLGDMAGLTSIHVSRTIKALREDRLAIIRSQRPEILDWDGLVRAAEFTPEYLLCGVNERDVL